MIERDPPLDFVVIGAQRAASTHLSACLRDHPGIFMCGDEVPFFERPFFDNSPPSALAEVFATADPSQRWGIQRPDYLGRPECAPNIRSLVPEALIIAVLRDPVARAVSAYFWYVQFGLLPLLPLDEGMARLLDGWTDPAHPRAGEVIEFGFYGRHLRRYVDVFGEDRLLVLLDQDLRDDSLFPRLYGFLDVDPGHRPRSTVGPTNAGVYEARRLRILRARRRLAWSWDSVTEYRYRPRRLRRPVASAASAAVVGLDRVVLARLLKRGSPVLQPALERRLRDLYATDLGALESLLGRDLAGWAPASQGDGHEAVDG